MKKKSEIRNPKSEMAALQLAIQRTEANIAATEAALNGLRSKHHNQCAELARQLRTVECAGLTAPFPGRSSRNNKAASSRRTPRKP
jgi:septal ring factor EnvC (AmiA/AmiB activator)